MAALLAGIIAVGARPARATVSGLPSPTPAEALWYAVSYDLTQYADALRSDTTPARRKDNVYQANYVAKILARPTTRAMALETAGTVCAKLSEADGNSGRLRATGHYIASVPTDSMFPGYFPRSRAGLREEIDVFLRRSAGAHADLLCTERAADVATVVDLWKGGAWAGNVARRIARDVSLKMGKNVSKGTVDENAKALLSAAVGAVCGSPVQSGDSVPCTVKGSPVTLVYGYGELDRREVGVHRDTPDGIRCSAFVTLDARPGKKPAVTYGYVSCYPTGN